MPNTSDIILDTLTDWGVDTIFGLPGDGINGLMEALRKREDRIRFILVRHEEAAAFAACAYAKFTGRLGVCIATTGPGGLHLLNGLYDAKMDNQPVLALTGSTYSDMQNSDYQQDVNLVRVMEDVAVYNTQVLSPEHGGFATNLACRTALARRGVAHLSVPIDVQEKKYEGEFTMHRREGQTTEMLPGLTVSPPRADLESAAALLNEAERPVILAGAGARRATRELITLAEHVQAPIVKALLGKDVVPDEHPLSLGGLGLLGTAPAEEAVENADALLMVGTNFPYAEFLPKPGEARAIQVDINPTRIGLRYPVEVGLVGDAQVTLRELAPLVSARGTRDWLVDLQGKMRDWWDHLENRATREDVPMKPQVIAWELGKRLRGDAIVTGDSGTNTTWVARYVKMREGQRFSCSGMLASMASGIPYAVAAQVAHPERQVVAFMGDGALLMLAGELSTVAQHDLPIKVIVIKNNELGQIMWEQMVFLGNPSFGVRFPSFDYAGLAESLGVKGYRVERPEDVGGVLDAALAYDGPALIEAVVDPNEPPMPARIKPGQAMHMAKALARGEPNRRQIALTLWRDKVRDFFGGGEEEAREEPSRLRRGT